MRQISAITSWIVFVETMCATCSFPLNKTCTAKLHAYLFWSCRVHCECVPCRFQLFSVRLWQKLSECHRDRSTLSLGQMTPVWHLLVSSRVSWGWKWIVRIEHDMFQHWIPLFVYLSYFLVGIGKIGARNGEYTYGGGAELGARFMVYITTSSPYLRWCVPLLIPFPC